MKVFLYTRYNDISNITGLDSVKSAENKLKHTIRDDDLMKWMLKENVGQFPKSVDEFRKLVPKFEDFSRTMPSELGMFFVFKNHHNSKDRECHLLHNGKWEIYPNFKTATIIFINADANIPYIINNYIKVFEKKMEIKIE